MMLTPTPLIVVATSSCDTQTQSPSQFRMSEADWTFWERSGADLKRAEVDLFWTKINSERGLLPETS